MGGLARVVKRELSDMIGTSMSELTFVKEREGIYQVSIGEELTHYAKRSDHLRDPFWFKTEEEADKYLHLYTLLAEKRIYPPDSKFIIQTAKEEKFYLRAMIPALKISNIQLYPRFHKKIKKKIEIYERIAKKFKKKEAGDIDWYLNWGQSKRKEFFFHDLHIFEELRDR